MPANGGAREVAASDLEAQARLVKPIRRNNSSVRLDFRCPHLKSCATLPLTVSTTKSHSPPMWPVQTLTLLLCLTDEEQLFAQQVPVFEEPARIEVAAPAPEEDALLLLVIEDQA